MVVEWLFSFIAQNPSVLIGGFLLYVFIFALSVLFAGPKPGKNPFAANHIRPLKPLVTDHHARDAVLKQRFKAAKVPDSLDAIIIGSGAGGLATAVLLGRVGKKCLVLEQHDQAGGCCHTFIEKGFEFDTGIHYIGEMNPDNMNRFLVDQLTDGQIDWVQMDEEFDVVALGDPAKAKRFPMLSGKDGVYWERLHQLFPNDKESIEKYRNLIVKLKKTSVSLGILKMLPLWLSKLLVQTGIFHLVFGRFFKHSKVTLQEVLDGLTNNEELKAVLSYICGDYGLLPREAPFSLHAVLINHYSHGAYYMRGGSSELPFNMIQIIEHQGGRVLVQAPVTKILTNDKGRAVGVRVHKGSGDVDIFAKAVISDAGAYNTLKVLLPPEIATKSGIYPYLEKVGQGTSCITTFIGLSGSSSELGMKASNTWAYLGNDLNGILGDYLSLSTEEIARCPFPLMYCSFPSAKDPSWEERYPGKSVCLLITFAQWDCFKEWKDGRVRHRGEKYEEIKKAIGKQMWQQCVSLFPQLDGKLEYIEVGTPISNRYYLGAPVGELYGLNHKSSRFSVETTMNLRPQTGIPGLYLTGQDILMCGFLSALHAAVMCSSAILHRNVHSDLQKLMKTVKKNQ